MNKLIPRYSGRKILAIFSFMGPSLGGVIYSLITSATLIKNASSDMVISDLFYYFVAYPLGGIFLGLIFYILPAFLVGSIVSLFRFKFSKLLILLLSFISSVVIYLYTKILFKEAIYSFQVEAVIIGILSIIICFTISFQQA